MSIVRPICRPLTRPLNPFRFGGGGSSYAYWNPSDKSANAILSDSNKVVTSNAAATSWVRSVTAKNSGKWRAQFVNTNHVSTTGCGFSTSASVGTFLGGTATAWALWGNYSSQLRRYNNNAFTAYTGTFATSDYVCLLIDLDNGRAWWRLNGTTISGNPAAGTGAMATFTGGTTIYLAADPFANLAAWRLRTDPAEMSGSSVSGFTDGWPT